MKQMTETTEMTTKKRFLCLLYMPYTKYYFAYEESLTKQILENEVANLQKLEADNNYDKNSVTLLKSQDI